MQKRWKNGGGEKALVARPIRFFLAASLRVILQDIGQLIQLETDTTLTQPKEER